MVVDNVGTRLVIQRFWNRMHKQNTNNIIVCTALPGKGKSYAMMRLMELISPYSGVEFVTFKMREFLQKASDKKYHKKGVVIILDESGVEANNKNFLKAVNKVLEYIVQTFRKNNQTFIFCLPHFNLLDKGVRILAHFIMQPLSIDRKENTCTVKVYETISNPVSNNSKGNKLWFRYPLFGIGGTFTHVMTIKLRKPGKKLCDAYEKKKDDYVNHDLTEEMMRMLGEDIDKPEDVKAKEAAQAFKDFMSSPTTYLLIQSIRQDAVASSTLRGKYIGVSRNVVLSNMAKLDQAGIIKGDGKGWVVNEAKAAEFLP